LGVIELKGTDTADLSKVENQAFGYKNNQPECVYVIISNFEKLRFYIDNAVDYEEFNLFQLTEDRFQVLWLCLYSEFLMNNKPKQIKDESLTQEEIITKKLYKDYSQFRNEVFNDLQVKNPEFDKLTLFKKTQKLLDRFLFIFFAEDRLLLPPNSIRVILNQWVELRDKYDEYIPLYDRFNKYFGYLNTGHKGKVHEIFAYNGGLFAPDEVLSNLKIDDELLFKHTQNLSNYDFESEVSVNILGHIFENSINEIEEIQAEIKEGSVDLSKSKRKKEGVYYTPKYITKYIIEQSVGGLCQEKKIELEIDEGDYNKDRKGRKKATIKALNDKLTLYRNWLLNITICDPACGSGAFLNQALEFLISEHLFIDEMQNKLLGGSLVIPNVENAILENNLYGVDINDESIEIAKLSLWLRTAQKQRKLTVLSNNIKCGNSLIEDFDFAGEKAFYWEREFPEIFKSGGFDVVIGNPPYGILIDEKFQSYYSAHFPLTSYKINLYILFIERMLQILKRGVVHFIIPKSLLFNSFYEGIRKALIQKTELNEIYTITEKVFDDAEVGGSLLLKFTIKEDPHLDNIVRLAVADKINNFTSNFGITENYVKQNFFLNVPNCEISVVSSKTQSIIKKLHDLNQVKDFYKLKNGLNPGNIKHILISETKASETHKPIIWGKEISPYHIDWSGQYVNYDPNIADTITIEDVKSKVGMNKQSRIDFGLRSVDLFETRKIVIRKTGDSLIACLDDNNFYFDTLVHGIYEKGGGYTLETILAILNSDPATVFYRLLHDIRGKVFAKISLDNLASFPFPKMESSYSEQLHDKASYLQETTKVLYSIQSDFYNLLEAKFDVPKANKKLRNWINIDYKEFLRVLKKGGVELSLSDEAKWMKFFNEQKEKANSIKTEINKTRMEINMLVCEIYGLTDEEKGIVEEQVNI